jgi:hypothetical protein
MADTCSDSRLRKEYSPPSPSNLHPLRQFKLWLGSGPQRYTRSTRLLGNT